MKKILVFAFDFPPNDGGVSRLSYEIAQGLAISGNSVTVLSVKPEHELHYQNGYIIKCNLNVVRVDRRRGFREYQALKYLLNISNKQDYTIICGLWNSEGWLSLLSGFKDVVVLTHGAEVLSGTSNMRKYLWINIFAKHVFNYSTKVVANSDYTAKLIKDIAPTANVSCVPLAVDENQFYPKESRVNEILVLGTVSRVLKYKAHDFVIKTIASLPVEYRDKVRYKIAGNGSYVDTLKNLVKQYNLSHIVEFIGFVSDDKLCDFYNELDCFVLCTREELENKRVEGFGLVFLESQSCSVPVIGAKSGGIPTAVENGNGGWLISPDNEEELVQLIMSFIDNPIMLQEQKKKARARVLDNFTWRHYLNRFKDTLSN